MTVSTHILDAVSGRPAAAVPAALSARDSDGSWRPVEEGATDADGRLRFAAETPAGVHRLTFDTGRYFASRGLLGFYPEVVITFSGAASGEGGGDGHVHVPLLLSPFAYSTYRGS